MRLFEYLIADRRWFDQLENAADGDGAFGCAHASPPAGWSRARSDGWVMWRPDSAGLPGQGWKVHVSARLAEADEVITLVADYCVRQQVAFKFLRSRVVYLARNEKAAPRGASGKLCTLYPVADTQLERVVRDLAELLAGYSGPYILSDLRWGNGPVYLRYGGFTLSWCAHPDTGEFVPAIRQPDGALIPDLREPVFRVPPWARVPGFIGDQIAAIAAEPDATLPYQVEEALHFSNGGGVYKAVDPASGQAVVLREARPHAGLDAHHDDAVSRLQRERAVLERLAGIDAVPELLGYFTCWEHHYLAEEYIEGEVLQHAIGARHPLIYPNRPKAEIREYVEWALSVQSQIAAALDAIHDRGLIYGDLHSFNVIVRPDGRVALVDFEETRPITTSRGAGLGTVGFVPPWPVTGIAGDEYAMNCLRLTFFLPMIPIFALDPGKAAELVRLAARQFDLPDDCRDRLLRGFRPPPDWDERAWRAGRPGLGRAADLGVLADGTGSESRPPDYRRWVTSMANAILASATPERADRLFPGDPQQFAEGGVSIAHGAAGVLYALSSVGGPILAEHVDWLANAARSCQPPLPGAYGGLDGVAVVLAMLGREDDALAVFDRADHYRRQVRRAGLHDGLAGIGLATLRLADLTGAADLRDQAAKISERLSLALSGAGGHGLIVPADAGLCQGWSGVAAFFIAMYEATGCESYLDQALTALRADLARCVQTRSGGLQVQDGERLLLYLATGSSGIGIVIRSLLSHRPDDDLAATVAAIADDLAAEFVTTSCLFEGRAGLLLAGTALTDDSHLAEHHLRHLAEHALTYQGHLAFPSGDLLRLSMDLATGTAGVMLAVHAAATRADASLPLLPDTARIERKTRLALSASGR